MNPLRKMLDWAVYAAMEPKIEKAVTEFHECLEGYGFEDFHSRAHAHFKQAVPEKEFVALLDSVRTKLGSLKSTEQIKRSVTWQKHPNAESRTNIVVTYNSVFANGKATETFNFISLEYNTVKLYEYTITSWDLIMAFIKPNVA